MSAYSDWGQRNFHYYANSVIFIEVRREDGELGIGTAFHVGNGVFVTARHVVEDKEIMQIGNELAFNSFRGIDGTTKGPSLNVAKGPFYHPDANVDLACFSADSTPEQEFPLGGHLDDFLGHHALLLNRTLVLGFPPVPLTNTPHLIACFGEINGLVETYIGSRHPSFIISTMARGGFSGSPVLVAYDEQNTITGTAVLGVVTQSLIHDGKPAETGFMTVTTVEPIYDMLEHHRILPESQRIEL